MAEVLTVYPIAKKLIPSGSIDLLNDDIKIAALNGLAFDPAHQYWSDVSASEVALGGTYAAGGALLASKVVDLDVADEEGYFDAADLLLGTGMTGTFDTLILYKDTGTAATSPLIGHIALDAAVTLAGQLYRIIPHADGFMRFL